MIGACDVIIATSGSSLGMGGPAMIEGGGLGVYGPEEIGPTEVQTANGVVDILVGDDARGCRRGEGGAVTARRQAVPGSAADQRMQRHLVPENRLRAYDVRPVIETLLDEGSGVELRLDYGHGDGHRARPHRRQAGRLLANNPPHPRAIDAEGADKATRFLRLCDARGLPVVSLCDTPGFMVGPDSERGGNRAPLRRHVRRRGGPVRAAGHRGAAQGLRARRDGHGLWLPACLDPHGGMADRGVRRHGPGGDGRLGHRRELEAIADPAERERRFAERVAQLYERGKALNAASLFEIDDVVDPADTRSVIAAALRHHRQGAGDAGP